MAGSLQRTAEKSPAREGGAARRASNPIRWPDRATGQSVGIDDERHRHQAVAGSLIADARYGAAELHVVGMGVPELHERPAVAAVPVAAGDRRAGDLVAVEEGQLVRGKVV